VCIYLGVEILLAYLEELVSHLTDALDRLQIVGGDGNRLKVAQEAYVR
jgi:hypothetical protein